MKCDYVINFLFDLRKFVKLKCDKNSALNERKEISFVGKMATSNPENPGSESKKPSGKKIYLKMTLKIWFSPSYKMFLKFRFLRRPTKFDEIS